MRMGTFVAVMALQAAVPAAGETIVAARTIRPQTVLTIDDLATKPGNVPGGVEDAGELIGLETRVALYAGRAIRSSDVGQPALVERNQIVPLVFERNGVRITADGRALDRAGPGEFLRVMNLSSRSTVSGRVLPDGRIQVSN